MITWYPRLVPRIALAHRVQKTTFVLTMKLESFKVSFNEMIRDSCSGAQI